MSEANAALSRAAPSTKSLTATPCGSLPIASIAAMTRGSRPTLFAASVSGFTALRALQGDLVFEFGGDGSVRLDGRGDDLADAQNDRAESRLDRPADFAFLERKGGVRDVLIDEPGPRDGAEARILEGKIFFRQKIVESRSRIEFCTGLLGLRIARKENLLDLTLFRRSETLVLDFLVAVSRVGGGDVIRFGDRGRRNRHDDEAAKFGGGIKLPVAFEVSFQLFPGGGR